MTIQNFKFCIVILIFTLYISNYIITIAKIQEICDTNEHETIVRAK